MDKFEIIGKKLEHKGKIVDFYTMDVKVPNGNIAEWDLIEHKGAAAVVPVDDEGKILMVRQYQGAIDDMMLEIPAGEETAWKRILRSVQQENWRKRPDTARRTSVI